MPETDHTFPPKNVNGVAETLGPLLEFATNTYMYLSPIAFLVLATVILGHICFTCAMLAPFSFSED